MRVIRLFSNADLRGSHKSLGDLAKSHGINVLTLSSEFVVFTNRKKNMVKIFAPGNVIAFYKSLDNRKIDERTIQHIPSCFTGGTFEYTKAVEKVIRKEFENRASF